MKLSRIKFALGVLAAATVLAVPATGWAANLQLGALVTVGAGAATTLTVPSATLDADGYVVVQEGTETTPGDIIGVSALTTAGTHANLAIELDREMEDGENLWVSIHTESDANTTFDSAVEVEAVAPVQVEVNVAGADGQGPLAGAQNRPEFAGQIPSRGVALVVFSGGTLAELIEAARAQGAATIAATFDGEFVVHVVGAPDFVNAMFESRFAAGVGPQTPMVLAKQ